MTLRDSFSEDEWKTLQRSPFWVSLIVASADGKADEKELKTIENEIQGALSRKNELTREILMSLALDPRGSILNVISDSRGPLEGLREIPRILERKTTMENAEAFKRDLLTIGIRVADASGGCFGIGSRICREEKEAIAAIAIALRASIK